MTSRCAVPPVRSPAALALAVLALVTMVGAGCSSSDDTNETSGGDTPTLSAVPLEEDDAGDTSTEGSPDTDDSDDSDDEEPAPSTTEPEVEDDPEPDLEPLPTTAEELAPALSEAELALRRPGADDPDEIDLSRAWGRRQQLLYRVLAAHPDWADQVLAGVDPEVSTAVEANWGAQTELTALVRTYTLSETVPAWRIIEPPPPDELLSYYEDAAEVTGVPWEMLAAIHLIETRMGRIEGVSTAGAVGPMQFLPSTWEECCEGDPTDPADAIHGAATYLVQRGAPDDLDRALRGYNTSEHYARAVNAYAAVMTEDSEAYLGYHAWEVHFLSSAGLIHLPIGYEQAEPVDATTWAADHPDDLLPMPPAS
jgi:hypothetical protein